MDTVTQIALGAAVGEATLGRKVGKRAILWGGICGLFPDLDVLIPLGDAVKDFTYLACKGERCEERRTRRTRR